MKLQLVEEAVAAASVLGKLDPARTAVLLIHWQRDVVEPEGVMGPHFAESVAASGVIERTKALRQAVRAAGGQVVYANVAHGPDALSIVPNAPVFAHALSSGACRRGTSGAAVIAQLAPRPDELQVAHSRASIFVDTGLDIWLRNRGVTTLLFAGIATNVAVESSTRAASDAGYWTVLVEDCCVAASPQAHESSIRNQRALLSDVVQAGDVISALGQLDDSARTDGDVPPPTQVVTH